MTPNTSQLLPREAERPSSIAGSARSPLKVAHVVLCLDAGGLEQMIIHLLRQGQRLGHEATVICLQHPGVLAPRAAELGVPLFSLQKGAGLRPALVGRLRSVLNELRPDVLHTHQIGALFYAGPAARWAGTPAIVHTEHGKHYGQRQRTRFVGRLAARFCDRFVCVSRDIAAAVRQHQIAHPSKIAVVPNGIDTAAYQSLPDAGEMRRSLNIPASARVIGTVGRLSAVKRQDLLLQAFASLHARRPNLCLLMVGDGPERAALERLADELGISDATRFVGFQDQPGWFLACMDAFALSSESEGMPLAVLEAWAAKTPVVASRVGGMPELIDHEVTGLMFPFPDHAALAEQLERALDDRALGERLVAAAFEKVMSCHDVAPMSDHYDCHYRELLGLRRGRGANLSHASQG